MGRNPETQLPRNGFEELPRPVATFLLNGCRRAPRDALIECLRELADDGVVRYETDAAGLPAFSLLAQGPRSGRPLLPFEEVALARVRKRAGRLGRVPFSALVTDEGDDYENLAKQLQDELGQAARQAGLAVKSAPGGSWRVTFALIAVALGTALYIHAVDWKLGDKIFAPVLIAAFLALFVPLCLRRWRLTPAGVAAVDSLRSYGYGPAGAAQGLYQDSGRTVWALDGTGAAPLPKDRAWSSLGGQWRTVQLGEVLSPASWSTKSGLYLVLACTFFGSFISLMIGGLAFGLDLAGKLIAIAPSALAAFVITSFWMPAYNGRMRLPDTVTFTGEVVRLRYVDGGSDSPDEHLAWIDDGSPVTVKFDVGSAVYPRLSVGGLVVVDWSPRRRCMNSVTPATAAVPDQAQGGGSYLR
jgi:hypothetical protein